MLTIYQIMNDIENDLKSEKVRNAPTKLVQKGKRGLNENTRAVPIGNSVSHHIPTTSFG